MAVAAAEAEALIEQRCKVRKLLPPPRTTVDDLVVVEGIVAAKVEMATRRRMPRETIRKAIVVVRLVRAVVVNTIQNRHKEQMLICEEKYV